jgi:hypothetical protein
MVFERIPSGVSISMPLAIFYTRGRLFDNELAKSQDLWIVRTAIKQHLIWVWGRLERLKTS